MSVLEKIKSDLEHWKSDGVHDDFESGALYMRDYALMVIEKYASEECDNDCEHCAYIECPKDDSDTVSYNDDFATALEKISKYEDRKACEDAVGRQASLNTIESMYQKCDGDLQTFHDLLVDCFEVLPNVQPKIPECEDAVSRQAVLKAVDKWYENNNQLILSDCVEDLIIAINYELPSVQPKLTEREDRK